MGRTKTLASDDRQKRIEGWVGRKRILTDQTKETLASLLLGI
jgi:hypothetical protein